jgi:hypothetical protein
MQAEQQRALLVIGLHAAFSDGVKDDRERLELRRITESLADESGTPDLARIYQDVLLKRVSIEAATAVLIDPGQRQLAYEMAVASAMPTAARARPNVVFWLS